MLLVAAGAAHAGALAPQKASADSRMSTAQAQRLMAARSARFVENKGQWDLQARFLARTGKLDLWFTDHGIRYDHYARAASNRKDAQRQIVDMTFVGGTASLPVGRNRLRVRMDYLRPGMTATGVGAFGEVFAKNVLSGVDMRNYFDKGRPRYDLIVAPGVDPKGVRLAFRGDDGLSIAEGMLRIATRAGGFANGQPVAYQTVNGKRVPVVASWKLVGKHEATFALGAYDRSKTLVIDPLVFGTYFGGNDNADEVRAVVADQDKNVYFTGATRSARFPVLNGGFTTGQNPQGLNINNGTGGGESDAFVSRVAGDAYAYDYSAFFGGSVSDVGQFIKFDPAGNVWVAGTTGSSDFPLNDRGNVQFLFSNGSTLPFSTNRNKATFRLNYRGSLGARLPYNATPAEVEANLKALLGANDVRRVASLDGRNIAQGGTYRVELIPTRPFPITVLNTFAGSSANPTNFGLNAIYRTLGISRNANGDPIVDNASPTEQQVRNYGSDPRGPNPGEPVSNYTLTFTNQDATPVVATTTNIQYNANNAAVQAVLNALQNHQNETANVDSTNDTPVGVDPNSQFRYRIRFTSTATPPIPGNLPENLIAVNNNLRPSNCSYTTTQVTDSFVIRLARDPIGRLSLAQTNSVLIFGSDNNDELTGFDVWPKPNATAATPVEFAITGTTSSPLLNTARAFPGGTVGYLARYDWDSTNAFQPVPLTDNGNVNDPANDLPYVRSRQGFAVDVRGVAFDPAGAAFITGTVYGSDNFTTGPTSQAFYTTNGIFDRGNQLRSYDAFVRKYNADNSVAYSGLVGGHGFDTAGGIGAGLDGTRVNTGSAIAIDQFGNAYLTGVSRSFDFPRTRGVYGETFSDVANIYVTKINASGSAILYSSNLRVNPGGNNLGDTPFTYQYAIAEPAGIAVDSRGYAYVTGNLRPNTVTFPGPTPGDPNQPTGSGYPSIQLVDAADGVYNGTTGSNFPTTEAFLTVLNPTATALALSTYIGGTLDDFVYAPSVSPYSDVFAVGWTDSSRGYSRVSSTGTPTIYIDTPFDFPLITDKAVKQVGDQEGGYSATLGYGIWNTNPNAAGGYGNAPPLYINAGYGRDGFITEFRVNAASVSNLTFNPTSIPGGLGASTIGTVTLSQGAPSGGGQVVISLPNGTTNATLSSDPNVDQDTKTIEIPEGATSATFQVYSKAVTNNTSVTVRATFEGTFRETAFQVVPWLQRLQLSNDTMVGGDPNRLRGTVTLAAPAPAGGVEVALSASPDSARIVGVPFTVPAGQTSAPFDIESDGVDAVTNVVISANLLGVTKTANLTLTPATLQSVTLTPSTVAGGSSATVVVTLNGKAGPAGYAVTLSENSAYATISPTSVTIAPQTVSTAGTTITINTTPLPTAQDAVATITATHQATPGHPFAQRSANLTIQALAIASVTLDPATVASGGTSTGTVTLATSAPAGGARVNLSTNPAYARILSSTGAALPVDGNGDAYITVAAGSKTGTFQVQARYVGASTQVTVTARQGGATGSATLTINPVAFTILVNPSSVSGGNNVVGTVTLTGDAPREALTFRITSGNASTVASGTVTIAAGSKTGTFTLTTTSVLASKTVTLTIGLIDGAGEVKGAKTVNVQVKAVGVSSLVALNPDGTQQKIVRSGTGALNLRATFDGPTPTLPAGYTATLTFSFSPASAFPTGARTFTIGSGTTSKEARFIAARVSRNTLVTITATYEIRDGNGNVATTSAATTTVTVAR